MQTTSRQNFDMFDMPARSVQRPRGALLAFSLTLTAAIATLPVKPAHSQSWIGPDGGDFNASPAYWNPNAIPSSTDVTNSSANGITLSSGDVDSISSFSSTGGASLVSANGSLTVTGDLTSNGLVSLINQSLLNVEGTFSASGGLLLDGASRIAGVGSTAYVTLQNMTISNTNVTVQSIQNVNSYARLENVTLDAGTTLNAGYPTFGAPGFREDSLEISNTTSSGDALGFTTAALTQLGGAVININYQCNLYVDATSADKAPIIGSDTGLVTINMAAAATLGTGYGFAGSYSGNTNPDIYNGTELILGKDLVANIEGIDASIGDALGETSVLNNGTIQVDTANSNVTIATGGNYNDAGSDIVNGTTGILKVDGANAGMYIVPGQVGTFTNNGLISIAGGGFVYLKDVRKLGNVTIDGNASSKLYLGSVAGPGGTIVTASDLYGVQIQHGGDGVFLSTGSELYLPNDTTFDATNMNVPDGTDDPSSYSALTLDGGTIVSPGLPLGDSKDLGALAHSDQLRFTANSGSLSNIVLDGNSTTRVNLNLTDSTSDASVILEVDQTLGFRDGNILNIGAVPGQGDAYFLIVGQAGYTYPSGYGFNERFNLGSVTTNGYVGYGFVNVGGYVADTGLEFLGTTVIDGAGGVGSTSEGVGAGNWIIGDGLMDANIAGRELDVYSGPDGNSNAYITNNGIMQSSANGSLLHIGSSAMGPVTNTADADIQAINDSTTEITGGTFENDGMIYAEKGSTVTLASGTSVQDSGATQVDGALTVTNSNNTYRIDGGTLSGSGTITGNVRVTGGDVLGGDKDAVSETIKPGTLTVTGNYTQTGGAFDTSISATATSLLSVGGSASLSGGTIGLELEGGFVPTVGTSYTVLTGASVSASFTNLGSKSLISDSTENYDFTVSSTGSAVMLTYGGIAGSSQSLPSLPSSTSGLTNIFTQIANGKWIDPTLASGYTLQTTDGSLFTKITLPTGFSDPFTITAADGTVLGSFSGGSTVDFTGLSGGGTDEFTVTGIDPETDATDDTAFPIETYFNNSTANVDMTPMTDTASAPEPGALALLIAGLGSAGLMAASRKGKQ